MLDIYGEISQELFCSAIMWGRSASSASGGILLEVTSFGKMIREEGFVAT